MKKKLIIAGAILVVLAGGFGVKYAYSSYRAAHTSSSNEYYYNEESDSEEDETTSPEASNASEDELPSRDEVDTTPDSIFCLVNKDYSLPSDYEPDDLVVPDITFSIDYESEKKYMREEAAEALETLFADALEDDLELVAVSGYRSYERQEEIYENNLKTRGTTHTNQYSAKPGYSEHQTGLVMDVSCESEGYDLQESFGETPEGIWLAENCYKYGFIIRYTEDKSDITGYAYEPWHIRYVGVALATYLTENDLTLDEYYYYEPSFDFITDESESVNDTDSSDYSGSSYTISSPTPSASPSTSYEYNNSGNTNNNTSSSTAPVASSVAPSVEATVSTAPESAEPEESTDSASDSTSSETPSTSSTPSTSPSVVPSTTAPSPSPSTSTTTTPPQTEEDSDVDSDDGASEALDETL